MKTLICGCCGSNTKGKQWFNQDTGYGLCPECAKWLKTRETPEQIERSYGVSGVNYEELPA